MNRTLYKFCENTSVLISYSLKAHVSPGHASSSGRGSGENMALELRKLFLSDPGGRLRARDEQIGFARARITVVAAADPNHAYLHKPHGQLVSPTSNQPLIASLHPTPPRWWEPSQAYELTNPLPCDLRAVRGSEGSGGRIVGCTVGPTAHLGPKSTLEVPAFHL